MKYVKLNNIHLKSKFKSISLKKQLLICMISSSGFAVGNLVSNQMINADSTNIDAQQTNSDDSYMGITHWGTAPISFDQNTGILTVGAGEISGNLLPDDNTKTGIKQINFSQPVTLSGNQGGIFKNFKDLTTILGFTNVNTSKLTSMADFFQGDNSLIGINGYNAIFLDDLDTSNVTDMHNIFDGVSSAVAVSVLGWNTSKVTSLNSTFANMTNLEATRGLNSWDTSNVRDLSYFLANDPAFLGFEGGNYHSNDYNKIYYYYTHLELNNWNTANVTSFRGMFENDSSLQSVDLRSFNTSGANFQTPDMFKNGIMSELWLGEKTYLSSDVGLNEANWSRDDYQDKTYPVYRTENLYNNSLAGHWSTALLATFQDELGNFISLNGEIIPKVESYNNIFTVAFTKLGSSTKDSDIESNKLVPDGYHLVYPDHSYLLDSNNSLDNPDIIIIRKDNAINIKLNFVDQDKNLIATKTLLQKANDVVDFSQYLPAGYQLMNEKQLVVGNDDQTVNIPVEKINVNTILEFVDEDSQKTLSNPVVSGQPGATIDLKDYVPKGYHLVNEDQSTVTAGQTDATHKIMVQADQQPPTNVKTTLEFVDEDGQKTLSNPVVSGQPGATIDLKDYVPKGYHLVDEDQNTVTAGQTDATHKILVEADQPAPTKVNTILEFVDEDSQKTLSNPVVSGQPGATIDLKDYVPKGYHLVDEDQSTVTAGQTDATHKILVEADQPAPTKVNTILEFVDEDSQKTLSNPVVSGQPGATIDLKDYVPKGYHLVDEDQNTVTAGQTDATHKIMVQADQQLPTNVKTTLEFVDEDSQKTLSNPVVSGQPGATIDLKNYVPKGYHLVDEDQSTVTAGQTDATHKIMVQADQHPPTNVKTTLEFVDEDSQKTLSNPVVSGQPGATIDLKNYVPKGYHLVDEDQSTVTAGQTDATYKILVKANQNSSSGSFETPSNNSGNGFLPSSNDNNSGTSSGGDGNATVTKYSKRRVYNLRKIDFYNQNLQVIRRYPRAKRINRAEFKILNKVTINGTQYYKVLDLNVSSKTNNKVGYIIANDDIIKPLYYQKVPNNYYVKVINRGVRLYNNSNLTSYVSHARKNKKLKVIKIVQQGTVYRFQLANGKYITANKRFVKDL